MNTSHLRTFFIIWVTAVLVFFTQSVGADMHEQMQEKMGQKTMEEKMAELRQMFSPDQAKVNTDAQGNITLILHSLNFDVSKATLKPENKPLLNNVHQAALLFPDYKIKITGHTDSLGDSEFNKRLSLERAKSVAQYMSEQFGMQPGQMETFGAGEGQPMSSNETFEGRKLNRRIEVTFMAP